MIEMVRQMSDLVQAGHQVVLVSSGAVFAGREMLGPPPRRKDLPFKQVLAASGQVRLMALYSEFFSFYGMTVAQALLTRADLADRERYLNARNTLLSLIELGVVPIVNENDVVTIDEIKIGDNDNLSALVANLVDADTLLLLTDQSGLYTADPRLDPSAKLVEEVRVIDSGIRDAVSGGGKSSVGTGGMATKIEAAELATCSGTAVVIASGWEKDVLLRIVNGEKLGTHFPAVVSRVESRKRWILAEKPRGTVVIDQGAARALLEHGKSLLAAGVVDVEGSFERGHTVRLLTEEAKEIARGIAAYNSNDLTSIRGRKSDQIAAVLGYQFGPSVVHRDDLVITGKPSATHSRERTENAK